MKTTRPNPELRLIELVADQIQDDERLLDALGDGTASLEDVEAWYRRRKNAEASFVDSLGHAVSDMRAQGFSRVMRRGGGHSPERPRGMARWRRPGPRRAIS